MLSELKKKDLEKQGYRLVGEHSAIKVCSWTKKAIRGEGVCYKEAFYGINCHQCVQMTPALPVCTHRCEFCWRDIEHTQKQWTGKTDDPKFIVDECVKAHVKYLQGFGGLKKKDEQKYSTSLKPRHFAISLAGEPTFYPKIGELIAEIHKQGMTSFLVTNGTNPEALKKLIGKNEPTQLYITLPAPDKETYEKVCHPLIKDGWEKIQESLKLMNEFKCRKCVRLTLAKDFNMLNAKGYASLVKDIDFDFLECKAYMWVGYSRLRLNIENMPRHEEIKNFAQEIAKESGLKLIDEKTESRVILLMKEDKKDRIMRFD